MEKETLTPQEVRPINFHWAHDLLNSAEDWYKRYGRRRLFVSGKAKHQALMDKTLGLIYQNPRPQDLQPGGEKEKVV